MSQQNLSVWVNKRTVSLHGATAAMPALSPCCQLLFWLMSATVATKIGMNFEINISQVSCRVLFYFTLFYFIYFILEQLDDLFEGTYKSYLIPIFTIFRRLKLFDYPSFIYKMK